MQIVQKKDFFSSKEVKNHVDNNANYLKYLDWQFYWIKIIQKAIKKYFFKEVNLLKNYKFIKIC